VVFHDNSSGAEFLIASTVKTSETTKFEGKEYPLFRVEISSASHPFYTGNEKVIDTAGRVDRFKRRVASAKK
jgi:large subunit ribosomal protein L31